MVEAVRLARLLRALMPEECEVAGLLALLLMHDARHDARLDELGDLITLEDQDRSCWDSDQIAEATVILRTRSNNRVPGPTRSKPPSSRVTQRRLAQLPPIGARSPRCMTDSPTLLPHPWSS